MPSGPGTSEAQTAFAVLALFGHWPYADPLFTLPAEIGGEILKLMRICRRPEG